MDVVVKLGIIFNAGLIAFTSEVIPRLYYTYHRATDSHRRHIGYLEYSLSYIHVKDWNDEAKIEEMTTKNITKCYYMGYREPDYPYPHKHDYWRIVTVRLAAFTVYSIGFFVLMYLVNLMIDDTPSSVRTRLDRHKFLVKKHLDQERRQAREAVRRVKRAHPSLLLRNSIVGPKNENTKF
uniref:Anoctamin n=1 Tax=Romanomermis culicivorax TaxID=13658 RepID=A0A915IG43_ROMCU